MQVPCLYGPRKSKPKLKNKIYVLLFSFLFVLFCFLIWGQFPSTSSRGLVFGEAIYGRVFCVASLVCFYLEDLIRHGEAYFGILRYLLIHWWCFSFFGFVISLPNFCNWECSGDPTRQGVFRGIPGCPEGVPGVFLVSQKLKIEPELFNHTPELHRFLFSCAYC